MTRETFDYSTQKEIVQPDAISVLCAVVKLKGRSNDLLFLGWNSEFKPIITKDRYKLIGDALKSYNNFLMSSGLSLGSTNLSSITPAEFVFTVNALDVEDCRAEDSLVYGISTEYGANNIAVKETEVLSAIVEAKNNYWQDLGSADGRIKRMYCAFIRTPNLGSETGLALMFRQSITKQTNVDNFKAFVLDTFKKLLELDEEQEPENRKGYAEAVNKIFGVKRGKSLVQLFVKVSDEEAQEIEDKIKGVFFKPQGNTEKSKNEKSKKSLVQLFVKVSDDEAQEIEAKIKGVFFKPQDSEERLGSFHRDLSSLELEQLFALAEEMLRIAKRALNR